MWWIRLPDEDLIELLEAMPEAWPAAAIRCWLRYVDRCCTEGRPYWCPPNASARLLSSSQKCKRPGSAAIARVAGCSRSLAQRCIVATMAASRPKRQKRAERRQKRAEPLQNEDRRSSRMQSHTDGSRQIETEPLQKRAEPDDIDLSASRASADNGTSKADNADTGLRPIEREKVREKNARTSRDRINLAGESALQAIRARELARHPIGMDEAQARAAWAHLRELTGKHGAIMPRELHSDRRAAKRLTACLKAFGEGMAYTGWLNAGGASAGDTAPDEWLRACGVSP